MAPLAAIATLFERQTNRQSLATATTTNRQFEGSCAGNSRQGKRGESFKRVHFPDCHMLTGT